MDGSSLFDLWDKQLDATARLVELALTLRTDIRNAEWLGEAFVTEGLYLDQERFWWHRASLLDAELEKTNEYLEATEALFRFERDSLGQRLRRLEDLPPGGEWPLAPQRAALMRLYDSNHRLTLKSLSNYRALSVSVLIGEDIRGFDEEMWRAMRSELSGSGSEELRRDLLERIETLTTRIEKLMNPSTSED